MNEWLQKANDLIIWILGVGHSSVEKVIIAFCGIMVFFLILKLFTKEDGRGDAAWIRRVLAAIIIVASVVFGVVAAEIVIIPHVTNNMLQKIVPIVIPVLALMIIAVPLLMFLFKKDYGSALVTAVSAITAGVVVITMVSFIIDSLQGSDKEFIKLKRRTRDIDEFINK